MPSCKVCGKKIQNARPERHETVCGKPHLVSLMLGNITFCRKCGLAFLPSGLKQHDAQCQSLDSDAAEMYDEEEKVKELWRNFRQKKRRELKKAVGVLGVADFDSLDAFELAAEFNLWHVSRGKNSCEAEIAQEDSESILWPRFLKEYRGAIQ